MKYILAVLLAGLASGVSASDLPDCVGYDHTSWNNCAGTYTESDHKYVGEWKDGEFNGQGTYTFPNGNKYVGEFKDGRFNGQDTCTSTGGQNYLEWLETEAEVERKERARIAAEQARVAKEEEELARQEKREKAERIYNACLVDKGADVDMTVSSLESGVKATCRSIAEDPSFLEDLRYD